MCTDKLSMRCPKKVYIHGLFLTDVIIDQIQICFDTVLGNDACHFSILAFQNESASVVLQYVFRLLKEQCVIFLWLYHQH